MRWGLPEQEQFEEVSDAHWTGHIQGQRWLGGMGFGGCELLPRVDSPEPCKYGSLSWVQRCAHTVL